MSGRDEPLGALWAGGFRGVIRQERGVEGYWGGGWDGMYSEDYDSQNAFRSAAWQLSRLAALHAGSCSPCARGNAGNAVPPERRPGDAAIAESSR